MNISAHLPNVTRGVRAALCVPLLALALFGGAATGVFAHPPAGSPTHAASSEDIVAHVNAMLQYVYDNVGASESQKTQLASIVQRAQSDLAQLQSQHADGHQRIFGLLTQPTIDRDAVEAERVAHMSVHEQTSKRTMQFLVDVAEALTPAQRKALADHMSQHTAHSG